MQPLDAEWSLDRLGEYDHERHEYFRRKEVTPVLESNNPDGPGKPGLVTQGQRKTLVDWISRIHVAAQAASGGGPPLSLQSLFLAANILDRFLFTAEGGRGALTGEGWKFTCLACLGLGCKYEDIQPPSLWGLAVIATLGDDEAGNGFWGGGSCRGAGDVGVNLCGRRIGDEEVRAARKKIVAMEQRVLSALGYHLTVPTALTFLGEFIHRASLVEFLSEGPNAESLREKAQQILLRVLSDSSSLSHLPSALAAVALYCASSTAVTEGLTLSSSVFFTITDYQLRKLRRCVQYVRAVHTEGSAGGLGRRCEGPTTSTREAPVVADTSDGGIRREEKIANLREELAKERGRAINAEAMLEKGNTDLERPEEVQRRMERALEAKNQEMGTTLSTFAVSQRAAEQREQDLREDRHAMEEQIARLEAEKATLVRALSSRDSAMASLTAEMNLLKDQLATVSYEALNICGDLVEARVKADQEAASGLRVENVKHEIKRDNRGNISVSDLTTEAIDPNDSTMVDGIMQRAACRRSVGRTDMNEQSSRSHSVLTLYLKAINQSQRSTMKGTLHLVDLAGSERLGRSHAKGDRLKETRAINKSLSALTDVFVAISNKSSHIPFRNSKLTYLLQPALCGDGKTLMMVNLSPTQASYHESLSSLRFASQVKNVELRGTVKGIARSSRR